MIGTFRMMAGLDEIMNKSTAGDTMLEAAFNRLKEI